MKSKVSLGVLKLFLSLTLLMFIVACGKSAVKEDVFDPEASLKEANELIEKGDYDKAREVLDDIKARDASRKYATIASLRNADTYFEEEMYEEAVVEYESFLNLHSRHKYASYAQYKLAMSYYKRIRTVDVSYSWALRAKREFEKLQRNFPRNPYMSITDSRIKSCSRILAEYEFYVGSFYFKKGSYEAAANRFNGILTNYPDSKKESDSLYYLGLSYENMGQREKAIDTLTALIKKFPTTELSIEAKELIASFDKEK